MMRDFLISSNQSKGKDIELFIVDVLGLDQKEIQEDLDFYEESLDKLEEETVKDGSKLLDLENRPSLLAMMVYSYKCDRDLDEWLKDFAERNDTYHLDQKKNFLHMRHDFEQYCKVNKKSA